MTFLSDEGHSLVAGGRYDKSASVTDKLVAEKKRLERRLKDINRALDTLANNPEVQIALDAISRLGPL
jgi:ABC-type phosphate transport system auxiliary subunit